MCLFVVVVVMDVVFTLLVCLDVFFSVSSVVMGLVMAFCVSIRFRLFIF
jgi:hypothetical protein